MSRDGKITLTVTPDVLIGLHHVAAAVRDSAEAEGLSIYADVRDVCRAMESALRAHGWRPASNGTWVRGLS